MSVTAHSMRKSRQHGSGTNGRLHRVRWQAMVYPMNDTISFLKSLFPAEHHDNIWLVGGFVRDFIDARESRDIDLITILPPGMLEAVGFRPVAAKSAAPIHFLFHRKFGKIEAVTIASSEMLLDDLRRRDFTVNAMAMTLTGALIDPFGGKNDLRERRLRTCSERSFMDDPIRLFRGFRFEADGWRLLPEAERLIVGSDWEEQFAGIPVERFSREMLRALGGSEPVRFFQRMKDLKVGTTYLPELFGMPLVPAGPATFHPEGDLFSHAVQVLERVSAASQDITARFCALFHDLGKLATDPAVWPKHHRHEETGFALAVPFCNRLRLPAAMRTALAWSCRLHGLANRWHELRNSTRIDVAEKAIKSRTDRILPLLAVADKPGASLDGWEDAVRCASLSARELGLTQLQLEAHPPQERRALLMQKRVERLRIIRNG